MIKSREKSKAVIFDLDGTLINSLGDLAASGNELLEKYHLLPHTEDEYRYFVGNGSKKLVERIFPSLKDEKIEMLLKEYKDIYRKNVLARTKPYPDIDKLLQRLEESQIPSAVCTNKPEDLAKLLLAKLLPHNKFSFIIGDNGVFPRKPNPKAVLHIAYKWQIKPQNIAYVGDSMVDMQTAKNAKMLPVGVLWGFRLKEELLEHGAKYLLANPLELWEKIFR